MITRRNFIQALGMATVAGTTICLSGSAFGQTLKSKEFFAIPPETLSDPVLSFTGKDFIPFINTDFQIRHENLRRTEWLKLIDVKEFEHKANVEEGIRGESFSLMFSSLRETNFKSSRFEFTHFSFGTFMLTISPVSAEPNRYEAIINHLER